MAAYILRRLLLMIPTILGIMAISFLVIQFAPGGPVERVIAQIQGPTSARPHASAAAPEISAATLPPMPAAGDAGLNSK
jgi:microcin C transport system permease protein